MIIDRITIKQMLNTNLVLHGTINWMDVALRPPTIPSTFEISGKKIDTEQLTTKNKIVAKTFLNKI